MKPWTGLSLMPEPAFMAAALTLFEGGEVEVLEWSFDTITQARHEPDWLPLLLHEYSRQGRLLAHGVRYSLLSGTFSRRQQNWLDRTKAELKRYPYRHLTEHFGFMTSGHFHKGAPLPVPLNTGSLALGQDRLKRLQHAAGPIPVGIENLAFAFSREQALEQASFLEKLVEPVQGFLILDLHNIWCQALNFGIEAGELIAAFPLHLVREIHVSGGSWSTISTSTKLIRRDTHDEALPGEVLKLLAHTLPLCPHTEAVIFERLGKSLTPHDERLQFVEDFRAVKRTVDLVCGEDKPPKQAAEIKEPGSPLDTKPISDIRLSEAQRDLISILTNQPSAQTAGILIQQHPLLKEIWRSDAWTTEMIETAILLLRKWN